MAVQLDFKEKRVCDMCCHESSCWAIGECDHPTCLRCCAKLRLLCGQRECSVCRLHLAVVLIVKQVKPYSSFNTRGWSGDRKYGLYFQTPKIQDAYNHLKGNRCIKCTGGQVYFRTFKQLREHMNKVHALHYCEICVESLMLFPAEFKVYTRQELTRHRREGDPDDGSHKGHPVCQFCDERYLDNDALHSHLHKNHFWCHFCEAEGIQDFFASYPLLRQHFKNEHYLCEEDACKQEQFTAVFRSKIDLQAHRANIHAKGLSKAAAKQLRQVDTGFTYANKREDEPGPRFRRLVTTRGGTSERTTVQLIEREELELATAMSASAQPTKERKSKKSTETKKRKTSPTAITPAPPGFGIQPDTVNLKPKSTPDPKNITQTSNLDRPPGFEPLVTTVTSANESETEWPDLSGSERKKTIEPPKQQPPSLGYSVQVGGPNLPLGNLSNDTAFPALSEPTNTPSPPSALDYSGVSVPVTTTHLSHYQPVTQSIHVSTDTPALSHQAFPPIDVAFPPLSSATKKAVPVLTADTNTASAKGAKKKATSPVLANIRQALGHDKEKFTQFKTLSGWYKNSEITIHEYAAQSSRLFGSVWLNIGPQLAELMPEESKKKEILSLFQNQPRLSNKSTNGYTQPPLSAWVTASAVPLAQAPRNKNVLSSRVLNDNDYPTLSAAANQPAPSKVGPHNAWDLSIRS